MVADSQNPEKFIEQNQGAAKAFRGDAPFVWTAINEVTQKLTQGSTILGWAMLIEERGWYGRVRDMRGEWSFGPSTKPRARNAVEAWVRHELFEKLEGEAMWWGNCNRFVGLRSVA